ncbi:hypothetical protein KKF61_04050 [Patescibacteria group bacterium]|nr:hypothetical protein [Patescibacteria group bacterium]MBU0963987.1 hypothetical protein [Patescibacteria group bacterium]
MEIHHASSVAEVIDIIGAGNPDPSSWGPDLVEIKLSTGDIITGSYYKGSKTPDIDYPITILPNSVLLGPVANLVKDGEDIIILSGRSDDTCRMIWKITRCGISHRVEQITDIISIVCAPEVPSDVTGDIWVKIALPDGRFLIGEKYTGADQPSISTTATTLTDTNAITGFVKHLVDNGITFTTKTGSDDQVVCIQWKMVEFL